MKMSLIASAVVCSTLSLSALVYSNSAAAHSNQSCNIEFDKDLVINSNSVQLQDSGNTLWLINDEGQLTLNGKTVKVNTETRELLRDYQAGIRHQTGETVALVEDALLIASEALTTVLNELTGK